MSRKSNMLPDECRKIIETVYGRQGQRKAARDIGRGEVTISRWLSGTTPIGDVEALLLRLIFVLHQERIAWHGLLREYTEAPKSLEDLL